MNIKVQGHSLTFIQGHSDSTFSNFFCSETAWPIEAKFHVEPGNENLFKYSRSHDHAHIWCKTSKIFFGYKRLITLKLGIIHRVLEYYQCFHMMTLGWPWPFFMKHCFWMLLHGWKLIQHWMLMYFQVCSNSGYPQHSGERYKTNVFLVFCLLWNFSQFKTYWKKPMNIFISTFCYTQISDLDCKWYEIPNNFINLSGGVIMQLGVKNLMLQSSRNLKYVYICVELLVLVWHWNILGSVFSKWGKKQYLKVLVL